MPQCSRISTPYSANYIHTYGHENFINKNYQCDHNRMDPYRQSTDGRGVTYWSSSPYINCSTNDNNSGATYTILPGHTIDVQFTVTKPRCYLSEAAFNLIFNAYAIPCELTGAVVTIECTLNNSDAAPIHLSGSGNGGWQAVELVNGHHLYPNDSYPNIVTNHYYIENTDDNTTVVIKNLQMIRTYAMGPMGPLEECDCNGNCGTGGCGEYGTTTDNSGDFYGRLDYPCNLDISSIGDNYGNCGGRSATFYQDFEFQYKAEENEVIIGTGQCLQWSFDWTNYSEYNYVAPEVCLFNFNGVVVTQSGGSTDVPLQLWVNGIHCYTYHISNSTEQGFAPTYNLVNCPPGVYHDDGYNEVALVNASNDHDVIMVDGINIYRVYKTASVCECPSGGCGECQTCEECQESCYLCYNGYCCQLCMDVCDFSCQSCQECYSACQECVSCYEPCEGCVSCYTCDSCDTCVANQGCETCVECEGYESCPWGWYVYCDECQLCQPAYTGCLPPEYTE
jgi:hypothetical protein